MMLLVVDTLQVVAALVICDTGVAVLAACLANCVKIAAVMVCIMAITGVTIDEEPSATLWWKASDIC